MVFPTELVCIRAVNSAAEPDDVRMNATQKPAKQDGFINTICLIEGVPPVRVEC
jgi:hypothetical protein